VRVWDLEAREALVWTRLNDPTALARSPDRVVQGVRPRFRFYAHEDGIPLSPFIQNLPLFFDLIASDLYLARVEELAAYPIPVFDRETKPQHIGPGLPIQGEFRWERPGDLGELRAQRQGSKSGAVEGRLRSPWRFPGERLSERGSAQGSERALLPAGPEHRSGPL